MPSTESHSTKRLAGRRVLVTRPEAQAQGLARLIEAEGGQALCFPTVAIADPAETSAIEDTIRRLEEFHWAVFVSANAVQRGLRWIFSRRGMPPDLGLAVVGPATARALAAFGLHPHLCPESGYNSESLLAMDELQRIEGKRVVIFRGEGGRELLSETLTARGAQVAYAEVYRRCLPPESVAADLRQTLAHSPVDAVVTTSQAILDNLCRLAEGAPLEALRARLLVVMSARQVERAKALGFAHIKVAREPGNAALVQAIIEEEGALS